MVRSPIESWRLAVLLMALALLIAVPASAGAAKPGVIAGKLVGGSVPTGNAGQATVLAVDARTAIVAGAARIGKSRSYRLRVPGGTYVLIAQTTRSGSAKPVTGIAPLTRVRAGKRVRLRVSLKRKRARKVRRSSNATALAAASANPPIVAVRGFKGTGPKAFMGRGLSNLLITDVVTGRDGCNPKVIEWDGRPAMQREIDLSNSRYGDPKTRIKKAWIEPEVFIDGQVDTNADGSLAWRIKLTERGSGRVVGGDQGTLGADGNFFEAEEQISRRLLDQLCGGGYEVTLLVNGRGVFATHDGSGKLLGSVSARPVASGAGQLPSRWSGTAATGWTDVAVAPKIPCSYVNPVTGGTLTVELEMTPGGALRVTWSTDVAGSMATVSVACPDAPVIPGQPAVSLVGTGPNSFEVPPGGGSQSIVGNVSLGTDGFFNDGLMTVKRLPPD